MLQLYCTAFLISQTFPLNKFLMTEHVLINRSNRMLLRNLVLFSGILFVCHTIGKYKTEEEIRMGKRKTPRITTESHRTRDLHIVYWSQV